MATDYDPIIDEAKDFLKLCNDADTQNRQEALEDLKFVNGDQWPVELQNSRNLESRPILTINKLDGIAAKSPTSSASNAHALRCTALTPKRRKRPLK